MTTNEKILEEKYSIIRNLVLNCIYCKNKNKRVQYGMMLMKHLRNSKQNDLNIVKLFDDMINKLTAAAQTIQTQNEWLNCIYAAIGDDQKIIYAANAAQKALNRYKKKRKD